MKRIERLLYPRRQRSGLPLAAGVILMVAATVSVMACRGNSNSDTTCPRHT